MSALVTAAEARAALAAYEADDENDGPMVALAERALRTVVAQSAEIAVWRDLPDVSQAMHALDIARAERDAMRTAVREYLAARDGWELPRALGGRAPAGAYDAFSEANAALRAIAGGGR